MTVHSLSTLMHPAQPTRTSLGILILRLVFGGTFIFHALGKLPDPGQFLGDILPAAVQWIVFLTELIGGLFLILGLFVPIVGLALTAIMIGAVNFHFSMGHPFAGGAHVWESAFLHGMGVLTLAILGAGRYSLDESLFKPSI